MFALSCCSRKGKQNGANKRKSGLENSKGEKVVKQPGKRRQRVSKQRAHWDFSLTSTTIVVFATGSCTHALTHSLLAHSFFSHSFTHSAMHSFTHSTHSFVACFVCRARRSSPWGEGEEFAAFFVMISQFFPACTVSQNSHTLTHTPAHTCSLVTRAYVFFYFFSVFAFSEKSLTLFVFLWKFLHVIVSAFLAEFLCSGRHIFPFPHTKDFHNFITPSQSVFPEAIRYSHIFI